MDKITFCLPSKDNLRYLKTAIPSIRKNSYRDDHDINVFVDSDNDGTVDWLLSVTDEYNLHIIINPYLGEKLYGIGKAYDECIKVSSTDVVMIFHADMMLGEHADYYAWKHLKVGTVVCSTRVEPPLHPNAGEKILRDYGVWPEEFKEEAFDNFVQGEKQSDKVTEGIFAPWMIYKSDFNKLGGHDPILKSCREDSDLFNRMLLAGYEFKQPWNSLVYHLTGRGAGSFSGDEARHKAWQQEMSNSTKEFIRKWSTNVLHEPLMKPIVAPRYRKTIICVNCNEKLIETLEPWCDQISVDCDFTNYIKEQQSTTEFDLSKRVIKYENNSPTADIYLTIDGAKFDNQDFQYIQQMSQIIEDSALEGEVYQLGNVTVKVNKKVDYSKELITL